jgi:hypothetical protein
MNIFKIIGVIGLLLISTGIVVKKRSNQDIFYIIGGIGIDIYSIYTGDIIFIILETIFTLASVYDFIKLSRQPKV